MAGYHAGVLIRSLLFGLPSKQKTSHIPWATYTDPELSQVGLTEAQAREKYGAKLDVVRFEFAGNDRAIATGQTTGLIKVMIVKGRPVGASIAGSGAGELIESKSLRHRALSPLDLRQRRVLNHRLSIPLFVICL